MRKRVLLIIMDGVGVAPRSKGNAVTLAKPRNLSVFWNTYPRTYLLASEEAVGLPTGTKGNSEVGHLNIGSGRVINQNLPRINKSIDSGVYSQNPTLLSALKYARKAGGDIHLLGCLSNGSVHAHIDHFEATLEALAHSNFEGNVFIHAFTDGRDTPPDSAKGFLRKMDDFCTRIGIGSISSICGRSIAMDRMQKWEKTQKVYNLLTKNEGLKFDTWAQAVDSAYNSGLTDEFIPPSKIVSAGDNSNIKEGDAVLFMNYRADRALQLTQSLADPAFSHFENPLLDKIFFASMVEYRKGLPNNVLFPKEYINLPIGKVLSSMGLRQLRIAETEKFPHVTYFFNGGISVKYQGEDRIEVPSPNVATYDLKPEMSAMEVLKILSYRISMDMYDFLVVNLANGDMVGHTGNLDASIKSVEVVDHCVSELAKRFTARGGTVLITADHGNVEEVVNLRNGEIDTEHSINPVPFIIVDKDLQGRMLPYGSLKDIAPTILNIMGIPIPSEMTGRPLI